MSMPSSTLPPSDLPSRSTPSFPWPSSKGRRSGPSSSSHSSPPKPPPLRSSSSASARYNSLVDSSFAGLDPVASSSRSRSPNPWSPSQPQQDLVDRVSWTLEENEEDSDEDGRLSTKGRGGGRRGMMRKMKSTTSLQVAGPPSFTRARVSSKLDARLRRARSTLGFHHHPHHPPQEPEPPTTPETLSFDPYEDHLVASSSDSSSITITAPPSSSPSPPSTPRGSFGSSFEVVEIGHRGGVLEGVKWGTRRGTSLEVREGRPKWEEEEEEEEGRWEEEGVVGGEERVHPAIDARW